MPVPIEIPASESEYSYEEYYGTEDGPSVAELNYSASAEAIISITDHRLSMDNRTENFPSSDFKPISESKLSPDKRLTNHVNVIEVNNFAEMDGENKFVVKPIEAQKRMSHEVSTKIVSDPVKIEAKKFSLKTQRPPEQIITLEPKPNLNMLPINNPM